MQLPPNQQDTPEPQDRSTRAGPLDSITMALDAAPARDSRPVPDGNHRGDTSMFCTACGTKNTTDANYCKQCGRRLEQTAPLRISDEAFAEAGGVDEQVRA